MSENQFPETKTCPQCGSEMKFREGTSKAGKPYKGYFCTNRTLNKETNVWEGCDYTEFVNDNPAPTWQPYEGTCPKCGGALVWKTTAKGDKMVKCVNGKYDFATKTASGCDYKDFPK